MSAATSLRPSGPASESVGRRARKRLLRDIDRDLKSKAKATLASLRAQLRAARVAHKHALADAVGRCRAHRLAVREKLQAERAHTLAELRAKGEAERAQARGACSLDKGKSTKGSGSAVEGARVALAAERAHQEGLKRIERGNRARAKERPRATAAERRSESDDEVRQSVPPELVGLWERVKRSIKAGPRETRLENFLRYAEEHPDEYLASIDDKTEAVIRDLERQEEEAYKRRQQDEDAYQRRRARARNPRHPGERALPAADPRAPCVELGELVTLVYRTKSGEHRHVFHGTAPRLAYNEGGLLVVGGRYRLDVPR